MSLTLPTVAPAGIILPECHELQWLPDPDYDSDNIEVRFITPIDGCLASGFGATPADALCGLLSAFPDTDEVKLPLAVAQSLDNLGHQAVRIVCNRLSGGQLESTSKPDADGCVVVSVGIKAKLA